DDEDGDPDYDVVAGDSKLIPGFTVSYKDWNAGFGAEGVWDDDSSTTSIWAHAETPAFKFGENEEFSVEAGAYAAMYNNDKYVGGGFKAAYAADKLSADIGTDLVVKRADVDFGFEAAANATYDFVTLNVYAASGTYFSYADEDPIKLDAKLSAAYKFDFNENVALDVTGFVEVRDALEKSMLLSVGATEATTVDAFKFEFAETADFYFLALEDTDAMTTLEISAKVTYTHEKFTAYAKLVPAFIFDTDENTDTFAALDFECGISSDKVVEGAVLALTYKGADFIDFENYKGAVTASCTINF
ncbi:MAG: hypothetical protein IJ863_09175, partial [Spirochaetales bacterium]|nr:hypothetical protein [Spirochaetales bacterium]